MTQAACFAAIALSLTACSAVAQTASTTDDLDHYVYHLRKPIACPRVVLDVTDDPAAKAWGETAKRLVEEWFPSVCQMLATEHFTAPRQIKLVIKPKIDAPAYTAGSEMTINGEWIAKHPDDFGMVIHELTHVIQAYPDGVDRPGWLVEGIADYVRWWRYEPDAPRPKVNPAKNSYKDGYRITAAFLAWASHKYHMGLVPALDRAMRESKDPMPIFQQLTGKDADALWAEFAPQK